MHQISLNLVQLIGIIIFIAIFTWTWIPKDNKSYTDEYLVLLDNNTKLKDQLKKAKRHIQVLRSTESTMGESVSAHTSVAKPASGFSKDNDIVREMVY